jgi:hypothetical protein
MAQKWPSVRPPFQAIGTPAVAEIKMKMAPLTPYCFQKFSNPKSTVTVLAVNIPDPTWHTERQHCSACSIASDALWCHRPCVLRCPMATPK